MGIRMKYYRVGKAEHVNELEDLQSEKARAESTSVDLYKIAVELAVIFLNDLNINKDEETMAYRMLFGRFIHEEVGDYICNGFVPAGEVGSIVQWITEQKLETFEGFKKFYEKLSTGVQRELPHMGMPTDIELFESYITPLVAFYKVAHKEENAILICGE